MSAVCVAGIVVALALAGQVEAPAGGDEWTDGAAGAWLWILVGLVPVVVAGLVTAWRRRARPGGLRPLAVATAVVLATVVGEAMHVADPFVDRQTAGCESVPGSTSPPSSSRRAWSRRCCAGGWRRWSSRSPCSAAWQRRWRWGSPSRSSEEPDLLPAVSPLQVPSLTFFDTPGEAVLLVLALGPVRRRRDPRVDAARREPRRATAGALARLEPAHRGAESWP